MATVAEVDALTEQLYTSSDNALRQQAMQTLEASTVEGADIGIFNTILQQSQSQYALLFAAQGLVRWFRVNGKYLDADQQRDLIVNRCGQCLQRIAVTANAPRHVLLSLVAMYAKLTKFTFEKEPYLREAVSDVVWLLDSTFQQCQSSFAVSPAADSQSGRPLSAGSEANAQGGAEGGSLEENRRIYFLALLLLDGLVVEFSKYDSSKAHTYMNFASHRRCSNNFRDECMMNVFQAALKQLELLTHKGFIVEVVDLVKDCLTFDFMAIMVDETEDALSAQFPTTWKELLLSQRTQEILWGQHRALPYPHCEVLLAGLTSVCGIRRTFFDAAEDRLAYIDATLSRLVDVMTAPPAADSRLTIPHYVNTLGDACTRLIAPFGYRDLHQSRVFMPWVRALYELSRQVFATPFGQNGSFTTATTLMGFWARLCTSRRMYAGTDEPPGDIDQLAPSVALDIFSSRVHVLSGDGASLNPNRTPLMSSGSAPGANGGSSSTPPRSGADEIAVMESLVDDMDSALEAVLSQSDALGNIAVVEQKGTMQALANYVQQLGPAVLHSPLSTGWLFFLAGSLARHVLNNLNDNALDGCGNFFMFCVDCASHRRLSGGAVVTLFPDAEANRVLSNFVEKGLLHMLSNMQNVFSSIRQHTSLGLLVTNLFQTRGQLFQFVLDNTGGNMLRSPSGTADEETADIMRASIELIDEAVREVPSSILRELSFDLPPVVQLPLAQSINTYKLRTNLYHILWPLNLASRAAANSGGTTGSNRNYPAASASNEGGGGADSRYTTEVLQRFLRPITMCMQTTMTSSEGTSPIYVAGWLRDLRGVALALQDDVTNGPAAFCDFIEWFCDEYGVFQSVLASPVGESPIVTTSFLRLMIEMVNTRGGRMVLPGLAHHSVLGLSLFKNMCQFIRQVVERCITEEKIRLASQAGAAADSAHDLMMKPLCLAMTCLRKCVGDGVVPLGAMWFYQDDTYDATLLGLLRMLVVFPVSLFKLYPETTFAVVDLLRTICEDDSYQPLARLSADDLQVVLNFVIAVCEDTDTQTGTLIHGLSFLGFVAGFVRDVKALSLSPALRAGTSPTALPGTHHTPPPTPMQLPQYYAIPGGGGRLSGTPGRQNPSANDGSPGGRPPSRLAREARAALARTLAPMSDLWLKLISVGMSVIVLQDRAMSASCTVVYPIMEAYPPFWQQFVDSFVPTYPQVKQEKVREALSVLFNAAESSERFFSEVFTLRQTLRNL